MDVSQRRICLLLYPLKTCPYFSFLDSSGYLGESAYNHQMKSKIILRRKNNTASESSVLMGFYIEGKVAGCAQR